MNKLMTLVLLLIAVNTAQAHKPDQTYLYFRILKSDIDGRVEMSLKDINKILGSSIEIEKYRAQSADEKVVSPLPEDLNQYVAALQSYVKEKSSIRSVNGTHELLFTTAEILPQLGSAYVRLNFELSKDIPIPPSLDIDYNVLLQEDPIQTGGIIIEHNWKAGIFNNESLVSLWYKKDSGTQTLELAEQSIWKGVAALIKSGMWHIYIGLDHILFLFALLLPSVVRRRENYRDLPFTNQWEPASSFKAAFWYILRIVTLFTIAHSITLSLAAVNIINLPAKIVESLIAFSIGLAALLIIRPVVNRSEAKIAFGFGLFHGLGFASVLGEKGLADDYMLYSLFGFNVGVEIGQVLIICAIFPLLYFAGKSKMYPKLMLLCIAFLVVVSVYWCIERLFEVDFPIDDTIIRYIIAVRNKLGLP